MDGLLMSGAHRDQRGRCQGLLGTVFGLAVIIGPRLGV
jgi:hypothetical protein